MIAPTPRPSAPETRRGIAIERIIRIAQALQRARYGIGIISLAADVSEGTGQHWHERTIRRDLEVLGRLGLAEVSELGLCRWIGSGGFFEQPATAVALAMDATVHHQQAGHFREVN